jgi:hypothetical protein
MRLTGTIWVDEVMREQHRRREELAAWAERAARKELRREEDEVLKEWWAAAEADRPQVVARHREVFQRIHANRRRALRIAREERALCDARMRRLGYLVREGTDWPRFVRPGWTPPSKHGLATGQPTAHAGRNDYEAARSGQPKAR